MLRQILSQIANQTYIIKDNQTVNNIRLGRDKYGNTVYDAIQPRGMVKHRGLWQSNQKGVNTKGGCT